MFTFQQFLGFLLLMFILTAGFWLLFFLLGFLPYWVAGYFIDLKKQKKAEQDQ